MQSWHFGYEEALTSLACAIALGSFSGFDKLIVI
jgi:hypothetical protein